MARADRTACPFSYYARRMGEPATQRLPEPPVAINWSRPRTTLGERLMPGCECGAARRGDFERCTCD